MKKSKLIENLRERGLVSQITNEETLNLILEKKSIVLYCGFDPTSDSLHLGHLAPLLCLRHFQNAGHKIIILIGGATGMIGDPSFKNTERKLNPEKIIRKWTKKIHNQIELFFNVNCKERTITVVNNYDWLSKFNLLNFLREIGKYFSINQMINKKSVKQRINRNNQNISFTEFSYSLLQSYDFFFLNRFHNVILQIGGSDQWGNITSGIDLTRRLCKTEIFGITVPLITKNDKYKFGKTEKNTIWLDSRKTSPYKFYQFWINTTDEDVYRFLKIFTFLDIQVIHNMEKENKKNKKEFLRIPQYILANEVTYLVHGKNNLESAKRITKSIFGGNLKKLKEIDYEQLIQDGVPTIEAKKGIDLIQVLVDSKLEKSRRRARKTISSNAISINGERQSNQKYVFLENDRLFNRYTFIRKGKKNYFLICWK